LLSRNRALSHHRLEIIDIRDSRTIFRVRWGLNPPPELGMVMGIFVSLLSAFAKGVGSCSYLKAELDAEAVMFDSGPRIELA
jgi:hypothetical protein